MQSVPSPPERSTNNYSGSFLGELKEFKISGGARRPRVSLGDEPEALVGQTGRLAFRRERAVDRRAEGVHRRFRRRLVEGDGGKERGYCLVRAGRLGAAHDRQAAGERFLNHERKPLALARQDEDVARLVERG